MFTLLKADICRIFSRKGNFYGYLIAFLAVILVFSVGIPLLADFINSQLAEQDPTQTTDLSAMYTSPLPFLAGAMLLFGVVSIFASWCVSSVCWSEMSAGFNRTIVSRVGKRIYFLEKLVFALVVCFVFVIVGSIVGTLAAALTMGLAGMGSVPSLLLWLVLVTVVCWGNACLTITVLWLFKSNVLAALCALTLGGGIVSSIISLITSSIPKVGEAWASVAEWLPCSAFSALSVNIFDDQLVLSAMELAHVLVPAAVCVAIAFACVLGVLRRRDL